LARWTRHDASRARKLGAVQREHVLQDKLAGVACFSVNVPGVIEADDVVTLGQEAFSPSAKAAEQIYTERRFHQTQLYHESA
jgi:hypothetical protein